MNGQITVHEWTVICPLQNSNSHTEYQYSVCVSLLPLGGAKPLFKLFETAMRTDDKNRATEREGEKESQRGNDIKSGNEMRRREKLFQVRVSKCWCKCYFMFHKTGPAHLGWTGHTAWRPAGLLRRLKLNWSYSLYLLHHSFLSMVPCTAIITDQLCGPLGAPRKPGTSSQLWLNSNYSWKLRIITVARKLPFYHSWSSEKDSYIENKRIPDLKIQAY